MAEKNEENKEGKTCQRGPESKRMDDIIRDTIIVSKIREKDTNTFKEIEEGLIQDGNLEKEQIAAEYEAIVKKQLQMLQADERGRQALQNEIAEIKRKQQTRADVLRARVKALEIEKERAKRIANRPPPLPRSVKLLLKEQAKKDSELVSENLASNISPLEEISEENIENLEDKENIDEEYLAERRKMQEEWDKKAKKRFNEALKKNRQKQEHDAILKEIENAEKINRREMARNVSEPMGKVPCYLPDKLHHAEKQVAMEDVVQNIFKQKNPKEHVVEDLEGYEDKWEAKYKQIDSASESKMVDCVPSFLKENYFYLLQEESVLQCGKHFSGLDDSFDDLNTAYIESPPADILNSSKEMDAVISQLDQMRMELNEAYEKEIKPLLEAEARPKILSFDKSVEADILKLPTEDKAVEVEKTPVKMEAPLFSKSTQADLLQGGVMSFQRRDPGNMYKSHASNSGRYLPESFTCQSDTGSEMKSPRSPLESWSSSSYLSLPSKLGLPKVCKFCDSPGCTIPLVEDKRFHKDCVPLAKSLSKQSDDLIAKSLPPENVSPDELVKGKDSSSDELHSNSIKSKLTSYIQLVADKYLKKVTSPEVNSERASGVANRTPAVIDSKSLTAFSKYVEITDRRPVDTDPSQISPVSFGQFFRVRNKIGEEIKSHSDDKIEQYECKKLELKSSEYALLNNTNSSSEDELLQNCHEVIATNISHAFSIDNRLKTVSAEVSYSPDRSVSPDVAIEQPSKKESLTGYVYHDLSTIPEMDSFLTNDTKESSLDVEQRSPENESLPEKANLEDISSEEIDTTSASLVDAPVSEVAEIARSIRFIRKPSPEPIEMHGATEEQAPLIAGTLSDLQTPSSIVSNMQTPKHQIPYIQFLSDDQVSDFSSNADVKTSDAGSGSYDLLTPSSVSTLKSVSGSKSQVLPYSSSLRDSKTIQSPLTSMSALSKYFHDISSIGHDSEPPSKSSVQMDIKRQTELHESSSGAFMPMTPQTYLSTPSQISGKQKDYNIIERNHQYSLQNKNVLETFKTPESNADSFKPMTPHSNFSSVYKTPFKHQSLSTKPFSPRKDTKHASQIGVSSQKIADDSSLSTFKPLSLLSNVSTPKNISTKQTNISSNEKGAQILNKINEDYQNENTAGTNFQPMTPHSYFSSLSNIHAPSGNRLNEFSTEEELKKGSLNLRLKIPHPFKNKTTSQTYEEQVASNSPSFIYPVQLRLDVKDLTNSSADIRSNVMAESNIQQDSSRDDLLKGDLSARQMLFSKAPLKNYSDSKGADVQYTKGAEKAVKVPSAGFTPQLNLEDFTPSEKKEIDKNKNNISAAQMLASAKSVKSNKTDSSSKSPDRFLHSTNNNGAFVNSSSSQKNSALTINNDLKYSQEKLPSSINSVEKERGCSSSSHSEARPLSTSPNPILQALAQQLASPSEKLHIPCTTPSNGSSTTNLSEMFGESKITYKSTSVKSIEEIIQETGIMEEPSLTLMNTELTIRPDSPQKPRLFSEACSLLSDDLKTPSSLQSATSTLNTLSTPSDTASSPYYCDSPSLLSFLKHEQSCMNSDNIEEKKLSSKKTPQNEYKKRTKRLWNNLEEVRTKKLLEDRKEQMRQNRLKMKSYSKIVTKPKKN
ncbi:uncharacterized protein LOC129956855 [Argiope bruennichi]|uniref:uncharacterized protein LOC129956855 n=1 Tax=Argiope bruennichi TaxID=94029 RepID=UPI002495A682|nr:uncharacterized protein LOC129956855 [Argiope bruennichi]